MKSCSGELGCALSPKSAMFLKPGLRLRRSHMTAKLRWHSISRRWPGPHRCQASADRPAHSRGGPSPSARHATNPCRREIQFIDEDVNEPHRVVHANIIIDRLRRQKHLRAMVTRHMCHAGFYRTKSGSGIRMVRLSTWPAGILCPSGKRVSASKQKGMHHHLAGVRLTNSVQTGSGCQTRSRSTRARASSMPRIVRR